MPTKPKTNGDEWITGTEACRILGRAPGFLIRQARVKKSIRTNDEAGESPRYSRLDCERLAQDPIMSKKRKRAKEPKP
jgi:hypothetical protein